jgi:hypothetical protein
VEERLFCTRGSACCGMSRINARKARILYIAFLTRQRTRAGDHSHGLLAVFAYRKLPFLSICLWLVVKQARVGEWYWWLVADGARSSPWASLGGWAEKHFKHSTFDVALPALRSCSCAGPCLVLGAYRAVEPGDSVSRVRCGSYNYSYLLPAVTTSLAEYGGHYASIGVNRIFTPALG